MVGEYATKSKETESKLTHRNSSHCESILRKELFDIMTNEYNSKLVNKCPLFRAAIHEILIKNIICSSVWFTSFK